VPVPCTPPRIPFVSRTSTLTNDRATSSPSRVSSRWKTHLLSGVLLLFASAGFVGLSELALRLVLEPGDFLLAELVPDPVRGHRIMPGSTGHDELGFRNAAVPAAPRVLAFGDSMTYGVRAPASQSWPEHLSRMIDAPVYNLGLGGYGPLHYLQLARAYGPKFQAQTWVVGVYLGNDMMDAYNTAHDLEGWRSWRLSERPASALSPFDVVAAAAAPKKRFEATRHWLAQHSVLYAVVTAVLRTQLGIGKPSVEPVAPSADLRWSWTDGKDRHMDTVFQPMPVLAALDLNIPQVAEGYQITERALRELKAEARSQRARLVVLMIPTKERIYCSLLAQKQADAATPPAFTKLCAAEERLARRLGDFLRAEELDLIDPSEAIRQHLQAGERLYLNEPDGHFMGAGNAVVARVVAGRLEPRLASAAPTGK
jgi:SGNH hydrolase-like domain, acetyltransferase AlgX